MGQARAALTVWTERLELSCERIEAYASPAGGEVELAGAVRAAAGSAQVVVDVGGSRRAVATSEGERWRVTFSADGLGGSTTVAARTPSGETAMLRIAEELPLPPRQPWSVQELREALESGRHVIVCDRPSFDSRDVVGDALVVEGWSNAPAGIVHCWAQLEGARRVGGTTGLPTAELTGLVGEHPGIEQAGFRIVLDLSDCSRGMRRLSVCTEAEDGSEAIWGTRLLVDPDELHRRHLVARGTALRSSLPPGALTSPRVLVWRLGNPGAGSVQQGLQACVGGDCELMVLVAAGAELRSGALFELAAAAIHDPEADAFYGDHDHLDAAGSRCAPWCKPAWSVDHLRALDYIGPVLAIRPRAAGALAPASRTIYDLALGLAERDARVGHVPRMIATVTGGVPPVDVADEPEPRSHRELVSIVIPTSGHSGLIFRCLESIAARTAHPNLEVVVVDTSSGGLELGSDRVARLDGPFNFSAACNAGAAAANGDVLVFLNDDVEVVRGDWVGRMLDCALTPGVGPVGAKLLYPDGTIQHGGVAVTMPHGGAINILRGMPDGVQGRHGELAVVRNCSAVTAACMMISRPQFESLDGFDEEFALDYGDVDLCLRARESGQRIVFTPHAVLVHHESASRGSESEPDALRMLQDRWSARMRAGDPFYPALLDQDGMFSLPPIGDFAAPRAGTLAPG